MRYFNEKAVIADKEKKRLFYKLYIGDLGCFWNSTEQYVSDNMRHLLYNRLSTRIFPAAEKIVRKKKVADHFTIPTNYVYNISDKITQAVFGSGVSVKFDPEATEYTEWYREKNLDLMMSTQLQEAIAVGAAGIRFGFANNELQPEAFSYDNYFKKDGNVHFLYKIETEHSKQLRNEGKELVYVVVVVPEETSGYMQMHKIYEVPINDLLDFGDERRDILDEIFPDNNLDAEGFEQFTYPVEPYVLLNSGRYTNNVPESIFNDATQLIQAVWVLDTMTFLEIETNYLSKLAIAQSMLIRDPKTGEQKNLRSLEYIPLNPNGANTIEPKYIQKAMKEPHEVLKDFRNNMVDMIAQSTGIPSRMIANTTNQKLDAVGVTELDYKQFDDKIKRYQKQIELASRHIQELWFAVENQTVPTATFKFPSVFPESIERQRFYLDMYEAGLSSREDALQDIFRDETEDEIQERVESKEEEEESERATLPATGNVNLTTLL